MQDSGGDQLASLVTHILDDGELVSIDPRILKRASPRRAREIVEEIFKSRKSGVVYCGNIKGEKQVEITQLENTFKEKTEITLATVSEEGDISEETIKIYHYSPFDATGASLEKGMTILGLLLEAEKDKDNPVPVVTRQLEILGVWSKSFTLGGGPFILSPNAESIKHLPLPVQRKIAQEICAPALAQLRVASAASADEKGSNDNEGADETNAEPLAGSSSEDRSGGAEEESGEG